MNNHINRVHLGIKVEKKIYKPNNKLCEHCGGSFASFASILRHMYLRHPETMKYSRIEDDPNYKEREKHPCPDPGCNKVFCTRASVANHIKVSLLVNNKIDSMFVNYSIA